MILIAINRFTALILICSENYILTILNHLFFKDKKTCVYIYIYIYIHSIYISPYKIGEINLCHIQHPYVYPVLSCSSHLFFCEKSIFLYFLLFPSLPTLCDSSHIKVAYQFTGWTCNPAFSWLLRERLPVPAPNWTPTTWTFAPEPSWTQSTGRPALL